MVSELLILASGLGSRMKHLTKDIPKPMIKFAGKSLIENLLDSLPVEKFKVIHINIFYHKEIFRDFLEKELFPKFPNVKFNIIEESEFLESGGAILNAASYIKEDSFFCLNSDIYFPNGLKNVISQMLFKWKNLQEKSPNGLLLLAKSADSDFMMTENSEIIKKDFGNDLIFTGLQILSKSIFDRDLQKKFSLFKDFVNPSFRDPQTGILDGFYGEILNSEIIHLGTLEELEIAERNFS